MQPPHSTLSKKRLLTFVHRLQSTIPLALFDLMLTDRSVNDNMLDKGIANIIPETAFLFTSHSIF